MPIICPAILAADEQTFREQMNKVAHVAHRVQIDLTDGQFAPTPTVPPEQTWWPAGFAADFHLMYKDPIPAIRTILEHRPNLIIVHAEADGDFNQVISLCRQAATKIGVALLPQTPPEMIVQGLGFINHVLLFSGDLGSFGGRADLSLLGKAAFLKRHKPELEIGWDGGVNDQNVAQLVTGGIDVLTVGGYIQKSDNPEKAFRVLSRIADETGTT